MSGLRDLLTILCVLAGLVFFLAGTVGLLRFPDPLSRLHALTKADNLGLGFVVLGMLLRVESGQAAAKLIAVWLLAQLAGATASQLITRSASAPATKREDSLHAP
jgi:multicomponent Na+:H+ antiporter subunit G